MLRKKGEGQREVKRKDRGEQMGQGPDWEEGQRIMEWLRVRVGSTVGLGQEGAAEGNSTCFWDFLAFFIRFIFISCFLIRFFFWEMRWSTSTPH